jgi:hypothetical protein
MKLTIKKKWFDLIKKGKKDFEVRDAHLTLICEETGETLRKEIIGVDFLPLDSFTGQEEDFFECFEDENVILFKLKGGLNSSQP